MPRLVRLFYVKESPNVRLSPFAVVMSREDPCLFTKGMAILGACLYLSFGRANELSRAWQESELVASNMARKTMRKVGPQRGFSRHTSRFTEKILAERPSKTQASDKPRRLNYGFSFPLTTT